MQSNRHAIVVRADARAMGAVTALSTGNRDLGRRNRTIGLSEVISFNPSKGIDYDHGSVFTPPRATNHRATVTRDARREAQATIDRINKQRHTVTAADLPAIGNID